MSLSRELKKRVDSGEKELCIVKREGNEINQEESEDDPVEDAALLDDTCEIKRDSILVNSILSFHSIVIHWTYRFCFVCRLQSQDPTPICHRRSRRQSVFTPNSE